MKSAVKEISVLVNRRLPSDADMRSTRNKPISAICKRKTAYL